jgi:hypothetical protein
MFYYKIIGFFSIYQDEKHPHYQDGFYLHEDDPDCKEYKKDRHLDFEVIGSTDDDFEIYKENPGI